MQQPSQSSKILVKGLFKGRKLLTTPVIPFTSLFAAKLAQVPVARMLSDPAPFTKALRDCYKLIGYHGISLPLDTSLEAEACGCRVAWESEEECPVVIGHPLEGADTKEIASFDISMLEGRGRIPVLLEVLKRLHVEIGKEVALIGSLTGPFTLAMHLAGESFMHEFKEGTEKAQEVLGLTTKICIALSKIYCDRKIDLIVISEEWMSQLELSHIFRLIPAFNTLCNVIRFYRVNPVLLVRDCRASQVEEIFKLESDGIIFGANLPLVELGNLAAKNNRCFGKGIPESILLGPSENAGREVESMMREAGDVKGLFVSTGWEVPYQTPVENLHEIMRVMRKE